MLVNPQLIPSGKGWPIETRAKAITLNIPTVIDIIQTYGYTTYGDHGGGSYKRVGSVPSHSGYFQSNDGAYWELFGDWITPNQHGAKGDGVTNDYPAFLSAKDQAVAVGCGLQFLVGDFLWDLTAVGTAVWDLARTVRGAKRCIPVRGMGDGNTSIHITNATSIGWHIYSTTDWFDLELEGFTVYGSFDFPLCVIGKNDYSDPLNMCVLTNVSFENASNTANNEALRLNYITGGTARNLRCNAYANGAGTNTGTGLRCRQVEFMSFVGGAYGNADRGVDFTDGVSFACSFIGATLENCDYCFSNRSANSGAHTVIGCQFSEVVTYSIYSSAALSGEPITFIGCNYTASGDLVDPANYAGVRIIHSRSVTTPAVPASTVSATNTSGVPVVVYIWGGTVSAITINGFGFGMITGSFILQPGSSISITYTVAPSWQWHNLQA